MILARRGKVQEAERLGRDAVVIAERTDWLNLQGWPPTASDRRQLPRAAAVWQ